MIGAANPWGILLPESILQSRVIGVLAAFVAINTVMYVALTVAKMLPKVYVYDLIVPRNRRRETRSIHPEVPVDLDPRDRPEPAAGFPEGRLADAESPSGKVLLGSGATSVSAAPGVAALQFIQVHAFWMSGSVDVLRAPGSTSVRVAQRHRAVRPRPGRLGPVDSGRSRASSP